LAATLFPLESPPSGVSAVAMIPDTNPPAITANKKSLAIRVNVLSSSGEILLGSHKKAATIGRPFECVPAT
jgi:hypothetical protein